jgi:hypothetical protein
MVVFVKPVGLIIQEPTRSPYTGPDQRAPARIAGEGADGRTSESAEGCTASDALRLR